MGTAYDPKLAAAVQAHQQGRLAEAERLYEVVLRKRPNDALALANLGVLYEQTSRPEEAIRIYQRAIEAAPDDAERYLRLGNALWSSERPKEAVDAYAQAARLSEAAPAYVQLGEALLHLGRVTEAIDAYERSIQIHPRDAYAFAKLALALNLSERSEEAIAAATRATEFEAGAAFVWFNLGEILIAAGRAAKAENCYVRGLRLAPNDLGGHFGQTELLLSLGRAEEAVASAKRVERLATGHPRASFDLGRAYQLLKRNDEAAIAYRRSIELAPDRSEARFNLAMVLLEQGRLDEALSELSKVAGPLASAARVRTVLAEPVIADSREQIAAGRAETLKWLEALREEDLRVESPQLAIGTPGFFFAYQGLDNRDLMMSIAGLMRQIVPDLVWTAEDQTSGEGRIRIGMLSSHFREHTVGRITAGLIEQMDREKFEVVVLRPPGVRDAFAEEIAGLADRVVEISGDFRRAREQVAAEKLDVIYFPDIGMDPFTYYLAFSRMAPVQAAGWGHADTTGIPNVDYFVSCRPFEAAGAEARYSERLVLLDRINNYYPSPDADFEPVSRVELGLPEGVPLYLCPQSAFKLHPDFDESLRAILELDPKGIVAVSSGAEEHWNEILRARFRRTIPEHEDRIVFIPRVSAEKFRGLLALPDVILDPRHFTGGHTSYLALSVGTPIVTWDGSHLRSRMTAGLYEQMGLAGPVASNSEQFAELAVGIATDPGCRAALSDEIRQKSPFLFEDLEAVRGFERFLVSACRNAEVPSGASEGILGAGKPHVL